MVVTRRNGGSVPSIVRARSAQTEWAAGGALYGFPMSKHAALSPSRAKDFKQCPLLFRFRVIDRLAEPPSPEEFPENGLPPLPTSTPDWRRASNKASIPDVCFTNNFPS